MIRELRLLGYRVELLGTPACASRIFDQIFDPVPNVPKTAEKNEAAKAA
jgi:hypothetical protein